MNRNNLLKYGLLSLAIVLVAWVFLVPEFAFASTIQAFNAPLTESKSTLKTVILPLSYLAALVLCLWMFSRPGGPGIALVCGFAATIIFVVAMTVA